jgi:hypothetical protein
MGCRVDIPSALVTFLVKGDWFLWNSNEPGKVTVMLLGTADSTSDSQEDFEEKARMILQQSEGDGLDADSIKKLSKFLLCKTKDIYKLKGQLKTCICFFSIVLGEHSVVTLQLSQLYQKLKINELKLIANFKRDPFFDIKLFYQIDRCLVQFLRASRWLTILRMCVLI